MIRRAGLQLLIWFSCASCVAGQSPSATAPAAGLPCGPLACSTLIPASSVEDPHTADCAYRAGNQWWIDYVAAPLTWHAPAAAPVTVALFDDGADIGHVELRNRLWTNEAEATGVPGVDDDGNGYIDDVHGWDFVDDDPDVAPSGECRGRPSHGTFMASLIAAERNNGGMVGVGAEGARVMVLRVVGCGRSVEDSRADPERLTKALEYATRMGARILSFSAHWNATTPQLDAAFADIADRADSPRAAIVVASVPNRGEPEAGYPAAYPFRRIVRAVPIGNDDSISPGTSPAPVGFNLGAPSACVLGATAAPDRYGVRNGSSNSTAILSGLLAAIWSRTPYARLTVDEFLAEVIEKRLHGSPRRSKPGGREPYLDGVPLADACTLADARRSALVCALENQ